ncbi:hypothetical protein [Dictyobacter aurantiacus]|uniref:Uncharacterized protein n=1 Tax=Dictyobacter aurantiacus TaxID=1936993 RepID=A0A401ZL26_9CHLR|nr:hypothetical protein [Dictyobacter aurantiacus]GCE07528.1 hypothetical protein KDAU_48570 [Dictyobacter aurantiacus]
MLLYNPENKGRILTIEHPTESIPALMVFSGNAGQLLRGDIPTVNILKAMRQRAQRNGVPFTMHLQEAGAMNSRSVGMTRLLEDVFGDEIVIFRYGTEETNGQVRDGMDQYIVSSRNLVIRSRSAIHLTMVERKFMRRNQRVALNTSYDLMLPNGEKIYLETTGFHYDLGLTPTSTQISRRQAVETRHGVEKLIQKDLGHQDGKAQIGLKGLVTFSGDGNTRGFIGTRWQTDRVEYLKQGLGEGVKEATAEINVTANLPHSIQQEFLEQKNSFTRLAGHVVNSAIDAIDVTTGSKWGERKLDHQFYRDFVINSDGLLVPLHRFDVIENNVFYNFANADHYFISTLFGYHAAEDEQMAAD